MKCMKKYLSVLLVVFSSVLVSCQSKVFSCTLLCQNEPLNALTKESQDAEITGSSKDPLLQFGFTQAQFGSLKKMHDSFCGSALEIVVEAGDGASSNPFEMGFLYENPSIQSPVVRVDSDYLKKNGKIALSLCIGKNDVVPAGFYTAYGSSYKITSCRFTDAKIGYDFDYSNGENKIALYALGPSGGNVPYKKIDFADGGNVFGESNSQSSVFPYIEFEVLPSKNLGTSDYPATLKVNYGKDSFTVKRSPVQNHYTLNCGAVTSPFAEIRFEDNPDVLKLMMRTYDAKTFSPREDGSVVAPLVADIGLVMDWPQENWRIEDYELYRWEILPSVLIFDFADYTIQNEFFTRIAYFVEKKGYKGTLVGDDFVRDAHGYNAHDYKAADLARFYNLAADSGFKLNKREYILRNILLYNGILVNGSNGKVEAGEGSVISISRESTAGLRRQLMAHESWHGLYFSSEQFRNYVAEVYNRFEERSMGFLRTYFSTYASLQYDINDDYLMKNEFMAYLLQQHYSKTGDYFTTRANWNQIAKANPSDSGHVSSSRARAFTKASMELSEYVFNHWGFVAGSTALVIKER